MPKRRRLFTPLKNKAKPTINTRSSDAKEVTTARGRLKGALLDALEPTGEDSESSSENNLAEQEESSNSEQSDQDDYFGTHRQSPQRQSYVLKLFDRSVDLSQFSEDSPLYPICRAWIYNQPRANYKKFGKKYKAPEPTTVSILLPGPEGPPISKIPALVPEQQSANKDNINLNYNESVTPSRESLLASHAARWTAVRQAWLDQANRVEVRYEATQELLNKINVNSL